MSLHEFVVNIPILINFFLDTREISKPFQDHTFEDSQVLYVVQEFLPTLVSFLQRREFQHLRPERSEYTSRLVLANVEVFTFRSKAFVTEEEVV